MNFYNPQLGILANQDKGGIPLIIASDIPLMRHNPMASAGELYVPDTLDAHGGMDSNFAPPLLPFAENGRLAVWAYNQNYQGVAPMELQPQLDLGKPWEMI